MAEAIDVARRDAEDQRRRIVPAEELPQKWARATSDHSKAVALEALAAEHLAASEELRRPQADKVSAARLSLANTQERASGARSELARLRALQMAFEELTAVQANQTNSEQRLTELEKARSAAAAAVSVAGEMVGQRRRVEQEWVSASARVAAMEEANAAMGRLAAAAAERISLIAELNRLRLQATDIASQVASAEGAIKAQERAVNDANATAQALQSRGSAVQGAVSMIAAHIDERDQTCPVCSSEFDVGELKRLVSASVRAIDESLVAADALVRQTKASLRKAIASLSALRLQLREVEGAEKQTNERIAGAEAIRSGTLSLPVLAGVAESEAENYVARELVSARQVYHAIDDRRKGERQHPDLEAEVTRLRVELQTVEEAANQVVQQRAAWASRITELEAAIGPNAQDMTSERRNNLLSEVAVRDAECQATEATASRQLEEAERAFAAAALSYTAAGAAANSATKAVSIAKDLVDTLRRQWQQMGLDGEPSSATLTLRIEVLDKQVAAATNLASEHREAVEAFSAWERAEELRQIEKRMVDACTASGGTEEAHSARLKAAVDEAERELTAARDAKNYKTDLVERLKGEASKYATAVLRPLNELNAGFLRMFSCFSDFTVSLDARTRNANVQLELVLRWLSASADGAFPSSVRQYLSEGQLSALSVSLLMSMSTMYRWSKWRALLLDDPLQHNDVIHAASFIEVLRGLVNREKYQIILSTHDLELADYIRRKLIAGKIDCRTCKFVGMSRRGVLSEHS